MENFQIKISPALLKLVGEIERARGEWGYLSRSSQAAIEQISNRAIRRAVLAILALESNSAERTSQLTTSFRSVEIENLSESDEEVRKISHSFQSANKIADLLNCRANFGQILDKHPDRRRVECEFLTGVGDNLRRESVFRCVQPYLVERRLSELLAWREQQLSGDSLHPLIVAGAFHLCLLQIHPFERENHAAAILLTTAILREAGFRAFDYGHFAPFLALRSHQYVSALRQSEKTAYSTWSTLNIWLEFFLTQLRDAHRRVIEECGAKSDEQALTDTQRLVLEIVREKGAASREAVVERTGMHFSTVKYNLTALTERGFLRREGAGRGTHYRVN